jgi:hypothetical protein
MGGNFCFEKKKFVQIQKIKEVLMPGIYKISE